MTYPTPPPSFTPPTPPPNRLPLSVKVALWVGGGIVTTLLLLAVIGTIRQGMERKAGAAGTGRPVSTSAVDTAADEAAAVPEPAPTVTPSITDFKLTPKITQKHCFGSAGCNVTFNMDLAYNGPALDPEQTWELTYEVYGVEDAPLIDTLQLTGTRYEGQEQSVSTTSSAKKLSVKVTSVDLQ